MIKIFALLACLAFVIFYTLCSSKNKGELKSRVRTIGIVSNQDAYREPRINFVTTTGTVKGVFYNASTSIVDDEKYVVYYDSTNPDKFEVEYWNPIFLDSEQTKTFEGKIVKGPYWTGTKSDEIRFEFIVNGTKIIRSQFLPPDYKLSFPNLKKGQHYEVQAWVKNASRCKIHLDRPIN